MLVCCRWGVGTAACFGTAAPTRRERWLLRRLCIHPASQVLLRVAQLFLLRLALQQDQARPAVPTTCCRLSRGATKTSYVAPSEYTRRTVPQTPCKLLSPQTDPVAAEAKARTETCACGAKDRTSSPRPSRSSAAAVSPVSSGERLWRYLGRYQRRCTATEQVTMQHKRGIAGGDTTNGTATAAIATAAVFVCAG